MEGLGGPVNAESYTLDGIDPTLDSCCQREVRCWAPKGKEKPMTPMVAYD
jgi:hypothetical protein